MKTFNPILALIALAWSGACLAQADLSGTWEGTLTVDPSTQIDVQFIIAGQNGAYTAQLNAPDQPTLQNIPADSVSLNGNSLSISINSISGTYEGTVSDGAIAGTWTQQGTAFELNLAPYTAPTLSAADQQRIMGSWTGELRPIPNGEMVVPVVFHFQLDDNGEFQALFDSPDEGAFGLPLNSVSVDGDELVVTLNQARMEFTGTIGDGRIEGSWEQMGRSLPLILEPGSVERDSLDLSAEAFAMIEGPWNGSVGPLTVVIRFEEEAPGSYFGYLDSPDQGATGIPLNTVTVDGTQLNFTITAAQASFAGTIGADAIEGQWTQGQTVPLTLERGGYVANVDIPAEVRTRLVGMWRGEVNATELVFGFADTGGSFGATLSIPSLGANGLPLNGLSVDGDAIEFTVNAIQAQFSGTLSDGQIEGQWTRGGATNPLSLTRE